VGYAKPTWQAGFGDGVRDIPDVSLFAADGVWGHYYVFCFSDQRNGGSPCTGDPSTWAGGGGTSFSAPIMAGVQALINQKNGGPQGNPNYGLYALASSGVFNAITTGDNDQPCASNTDCFGYSVTSSGGGHGGRGGRGGNITYGVLSTSSTSYSAAYDAAKGWNFATGLGSIDVSKLISLWPSCSKGQACF
jgi:subtilisin family serine protease